MNRQVAVGLALLAVLWPTASTAATASPDARAARRYFERHGRPRLVPLLQEVLRFPTVAGNDKAHADQKEWLARTATSLGFSVKDAGMVTEIEMAGPAGAPVLGLVIHGDVQPVEEAMWTVPPFAGVVRKGSVWGRGAADDKGPLVQTLLAMQAVAQSRVPRTHTVRLLVGTNEESSSTDITEYLKTHEAPDYSLVLDAGFPVTVGEKGWNALRVSVGAETSDKGDGGKPWRAIDLEAGLAPSIVPDRARLVLRAEGTETDWEPLRARLRQRRPAAGTSLSLTPKGPELTVEVKGRSAHAGVNLGGGRNALVSLAEIVGDDLPRDGRGDLLRFARLAGRDLRGAGLDLPRPDPLWNGYDVNVAMVKTVEDRPSLTINIRRAPPWTGDELRRHLTTVVERFNREQGGRLQMDSEYFYGDDPLIIDPASPLIVRALAAYRRATGEKNAAPVVTGGGTYAKRLPRAAAFGMWFPGKPYPGHDVDEHIPVADLVRGTHVLIETLVDIACGVPLERDAAIVRR